MSAGVLAAAPARGQILSWWPSGQDQDYMTGPSPSKEVRDKPYIHYVTEAESLRTERRRKAWDGTRDPRTTITTPFEEAAAWDEVSDLSRCYVGNVNGMNRTSLTLYLVLEAGNAEWEQAQKAGPETLQESVARTRRAIARAYFARQTIAKFRAWAAAAERNRAKFPYLLYDLYLRTREQIEQAEFKDNKEILAVKAAELSAMRKSLEDNPIVLPPKLDELTRYLEESHTVMLTALKTNELRAALAGEEVSRPAMLLGMDAYLRFYRGWREEQFREWQRSKMPKYYEAFHLSPPASIGEEARELARPFQPVAPAPEQPSRKVIREVTEHNRRVAEGRP
jgi:hypothetical protein